MLEVEASPADEDLSGHVVGKRRAEEKDCASSLGRSSESAERTSGLHRFQHGLLNPDPNLLPPHLNVRFPAGQGLCEASLNEAKAHGIYIDVIAAPLLGERSSQSDDPCLAGGISGLPGVAVRAGDGSDVDNFSHDAPASRN